LHLGELQPNDPEIGLVYDLDVQMAARTRQATLELATREDWIIAGSHLTGWPRATCRRGRGLPNLACVKHSVAHPKEVAAVRVAAVFRS